MSTTPTIQQYLLNLFIASRLKAAAAGGDPKAIARAHAAYDNVTEKDVQFGPYTRNDKTGKYQTTVSCKNRGWSANVSFNTGTLKVLASENLQGIAKVESLRMADIPGVFYIDENDSLYLVTEKDANIFDALALTGYSIPAESFKTKLYPELNVETRAVGQVDIDHPIVAGRFLLSYIQRTNTAVDDNKTVVDSLPKVDETKDEIDTKLDALKEALKEGNDSEAVPPVTGTDPATNLVTDTDNGEGKPEGGEETGAEETQEETQVVEQKAQNQNNNNNKNNNRK